MRPGGTRRQTGANLGSRLCTVLIRESDVSAPSHPFPSLPGRSPCPFASRFLLPLAGLLRASGKGTFATRLAPLFKIPTISTGDLIRAEIKAGSAIGLEVKALTEKGGLVSDEIVLDLLNKRLAQPDAQAGFILDGYPRRVSQADTLAKLHPLSLTVNLALDESILVEKALARRICESCGNGYNLANIQRDGYEMPPLLPKKKEGHCDKCDGKLITRSDDTEEIIRDRLGVYFKETFPIIEYYRAKGLLMEFPVKKGVADLPDLVKQIEARIGKQ